ncbi:MAG: hypothetical protein ACI9QC_000108 [Oceanicoccus sp.]|jgi:hypothetical protein
MTNTPPSLPSRPEGEASGVEAFNPLSIFAEGGIEDSVLDLPGVREALRETLIKGNGIESDFITAEGTIDLAAWRQTTVWQDRMGIYFKAMVGETIFGALSDSDLAVTDKQVEVLAPDFDDFIERNKALITTTENKNVIMRGDVALQKMLGKGQSIMEFINGMDDSTEVNTEIVQDMIKMQWPKGTTVVIPERKMDGEDRSITLMRQVIELSGLDVNVMSPGETGIAAAMGSNEIRLVLAPSGVPMKGAEIDLVSLDNLGNLYNRGQAVWYDPKLVAATLVRQGVPVADAIASLGLTPGMDPAEAAAYENYMKQLESIPVKGADIATTTTTATPTNE